ncbi:Hypothetical protein PHPALM_21203 [Phytophthora palmivora]|uniref:Uncharacterized protein n=1 Tax=Phytophthora palmivora TaxID=4796 RepID=A0A2P4XCZ4_9STRA|nr:Hypothetical protein PHPALM_21203 [Phytophthora palmivora]
MLHVIRSPVFQRQLLACGISTSRTLLMALQTVKLPLTSLNGAAMTAKLDIEGTLEEIASTHFSESSAFPEFSPVEDTLLSEAVPRMKSKSSSLASLNLAVRNAQLNFEGTLEEVASSHFSESSAFPEFTPMEDALLSEAVPLIKHNTTMASLNGAAIKAQLELSGTLEEVASSHFSESSAFPEFSPMEDTLLSEAVPRIKTRPVIMDAHSLAQEELNEEIQQHFCASSDFPEYSAAEEEAMIHKE